MYLYGRTLSRSHAPYAESPRPCSRALSKHSDESLFLKTVARTLEKKRSRQSDGRRPPGRYSLNTRSSPRRVAKSKMADSRVVTTTTHSFHPKDLSFFFFSLSLVKTGAGTVAASSFSWYTTVLRERTDPPLIIIHFCFVFFYTFFVSTSRVSSSFLHSRETSNHHLLFASAHITF